ncbi:MAG TPA: hypothetical protein VGM41_11895, partial [Chitinophagaceae bacterium]
SLHKKSSEELYEQIYNLFIEGKFDDALAMKHHADSLYGNHYWSPQLLYIEAVYHIQQRDDSSAIKALNHIVTLYPANPIVPRVKKLIEVLGRRREIEDYLINLKIEHAPEDSTKITIAPTRQQIGTPLLQDSTTVGKVKAPVTYIPPSKADSLRTLPPKPVAPALPTAFTYAPEKPHYVALVMDKVDPVYVNEAKNAFSRYHKEKYPDQTIAITPMPLTDDIRFVLFGAFDNAASAMDYIDKTRKLAATDIIPWMPPTKYSFILVSEINLELLKSNKDLPQYRKFLEQRFPTLFPPSGK